MRKQLATMLMVILVVVVVVALGFQIVSDNERRGRWTDPILNTPTCYDTMNLGQIEAKLEGIPRPDGPLLTTANEYILFGVSVYGPDGWTYWWWCKDEWVEIEPPPCEAQ